VTSAPMICRRRPKVKKKNNQEKTTKKEKRGNQKIKHINILNI